MRGGPSGDLYIFLSITPHELFQRDGADLYCRVPLAMTEAALGGEIEVPTIHGDREKVKISEGTQSGKQFRLKGKGMPVLRSREIGDLYIQVDVEIPKNLTKRQRELLEEFRQASSEANHPESAGFFSRPRSPVFPSRWRGRFASRSMGPLPDRSAFASSGDCSMTMSGTIPVAWMERPFGVK